jgi:hypothetical protein
VTRWEPYRASGHGGYDRIRHRDCGGYVQAHTYRWGWSCGSCLKFWSHEHLERWAGKAPDELAARFEGGVDLHGAGEHLVWCTDGKRRFSAVVPARQMGDPFTEA